MNRRYGSIQFLRFLVILLILLMVASILVAYWLRTQSQQKILYATDVLQEKDQTRTVLEQCLQSLYRADNHFRLYTLTYDPEYSRMFRHELKSLDSMFRVVEGTLSSDEEKWQKLNVIGVSAGQRESLMNYVARLRTVSDSMLKVAVSYDAAVVSGASPAGMNIRAFMPAARKLKTDTTDISSTTVKKKKGFFAKVKSFIKGETDTVKSRKQVTSQTSADTTQKEGDFEWNVEEVKAEVAIQSNNYYQGQLKLQYNLREELKQKEISLIRLNTNLVSKLSGMLQELLQEASVRRDEIRKLAVVSVKEQSGIMATGLYITLGLVLLMTFLIIMTIRRIIHYQRQIIEARIRAEDEAAEKGRFLAYMSHELRTPLTSIIGFAEQMRQTTMDKKQEQYIQAMMSSSDILLSTINDILDLSKLDTGKLRYFENPFFPVAVFEQVINSLRPLAGNKGLELLFACRIPAPMLLLGDEMRLKQVLINLVNNAIKYSEKGTITVFLSHETDGNRMILKASIRDEGIGIAEEHLSEVFQEYSQVHTPDSGKWIIGTGLGLPICKRMVEQQGGAIGVTSQKGVGSEFWFTIPYQVSSEVPADLQTPKTGHDKFHFAGKEVLVVDDTEINLVLLDSILTENGMKVTKARDGLQALERLEKQSFQLIISDVYMPEMDGIELAGRLRSSGKQAWQKIPFIVLTANIVQDEIDRFKAAGINDYMMKPFKANDLLKMIRKYL